MPYETIKDIVVDHFTIVEIPVEIETIVYKEKPVGKGIMEEEPDERVIEKEIEKYVEVINERVIEKVV